jgi:hypothetical protein
MMRRQQLAFLAGAVALVVGLSLAPRRAVGVRTAAAQTDGWQEATTRTFLILYRAGNEPERDYLLQNVEVLYADLATAFGTDLPSPITLRLYASRDDFFRDNPLALDRDGIIVQAHHRQRELGVLLPQVLAAGDQGLANAVRYELAHQFVVVLAQGRLPALLEEGVARYVEVPGEDRATWVARLRAAWTSNGLHRWSELVGPGAVYLDPPLTVVEALAVVQFLVDRSGFATLVTFVRSAGEASGWRSALEASYGEAPERLETAWRQWLPTYLDGGWRQNALYNRDLGGPQALLARGDYAAAITQLTGAVSALSRVDPAAAATAGELLARAQAASAARGGVSDAYRLLLAGDYAAALAEAEAARTAISAVGDASGAALAAEVGARARLGLDADRALQRSIALSTWRLPEARLLAYQAVVGYGRLGNDSAAARARALLTTLDRRQAPLGWALLVLGGAVLVLNLGRRRRDRRPVGP